MQEEPLTFNSVNKSFVENSTIPLKIQKNKNTIQNCFFPSLLGLMQYTVGDIWENL